MDWVLANVYVGPLSMGSKVSKKANEADVVKEKPNSSTPAHTASKSTTVEDRVSIECVVGSSLAHAYSNFGFSTKVQIKAHLFKQNKGPNYRKLKPSFHLKPTFKWVTDTGWGDAIFGYRLGLWEWVRRPIAPLYLAGL